MANGLLGLAQTAGPKKITVPLTKIAVGVGGGVIQLIATRLDQSRGTDPTNIMAIQNIAPLAMTGVGIILSLMKKASMRGLGNDLALVGGALSVLRLSTIVSSRAATRRFGGRSISLRRGSGAVMAQRTASMPYGMSVNLSSLG